jgi:hypothetical protein
MNFKDNEKLRRKASKLLKPLNHRICSCGKPVSKKVGLHRHTQTGKYSFGGIETCGNVWVCKVCATKVTEKRRQELLKAYNKHLGDGYIVGLLTLTFPHTKQDDLLDLSLKEAKATKLFKQRQGWKKFAKDIVGSIRGFEITHGSNGWHLHSHHLVFFDKKKITSAEFWRWEQGLYKAWQGACVTAGLPEPSPMYGVDLVFNATGEYIAKWGLDLEMTKSHLKTGKKKSKTPFQLLVSEDEADNELFKEFADVFVKKRKQQLRWSNSLKAKFGIEIKTDEELANEQTEESNNEVIITSKEYYHFWCNGLSYLLKTVLEKEGENGLKELLDKRNDVINYKKMKEREKIAFIT